MTQQQDVVKDEAYHEAAIQYNSELAALADDLARRLPHTEIKRWAKAVAKNHKFHLGRHKTALARLKKQEASVENEPAPADDPQTEQTEAVSEPRVIEDAEMHSVSLDVEPGPGGGYVESVPDASQAADPIQVGPDPELADDPTPAGVETPAEQTLSEEEAQAAFAKAKADAESQNGQ